MNDFDLPRRVAEAVAGDEEDDGQVPLTVSRGPATIRGVINERDFFTEKPEMRKNSLQCPQCRHRDDYQVKWVRRTKKPGCPAGATRATAIYDKLRDHLFRIDDVVTCSRCRRRFEIPSHQTMVFLDELPINQEEYED